ncbi:MAG: hypothetical protein VKK42_23435 [Lyngbya sp.]|nr:hypothetical protein [Lyngbya sp.]
MFRTNPDPSWHYAALWQSMGEIEEHMSFIQQKLCSEKARSQNDEIDKYVQKNLSQIRGIVNDWIYDIPENYEPDKTLN